MSDEAKLIPSLVIKGERHDVTALFIRINQVSNEEKEKFLKAVAKTIYLHRGVLSESPDGTFLAFFNIPVRQFKHELQAIRTALEIQKETQDLKTLKIGFGISNGKIIASDNKSGIINYTSLGDTVNLARKLSTKSENSVLFSKNVYDRIKENLKVNEDSELTKDLGVPVYALSRIVEREKYNDYIRSFLERMKKEGTKF